MDRPTSPILIDIQTHVTERTGRDHKVGPLLLRVLHMCPCHCYSDGFFFKNDGKSAAFGPSGIGHRFAADGLDDSLERLRIFRIVKAKIPRGTQDIAAIKWGDPKFAHRLSSQGAQASQSD